MASRWKWFLGGGVCGFVLGAVAFLVYLLATLELQDPVLTSSSLRVDRLDETLLTWVEREEHGVTVREQQDRYGLRFGDLRSSFPSGRPCWEMRFFDEQADGHAVAWGPEGQWILIGGYVDDRPHGTWIYFEDAHEIEPQVTCAVVTYEHGDREGPTTAWREDGSLDPQVTGWYEGDERVRDLEPDEVHRRPGC
jgi:hypothetical protein